jgi:hypothetical protein
MPAAQILLILSEYHIPETNNLSISNNEALCNILYVAIFIENRLISLPVITPADLSQGYDFAIDPIVLKGRRIYYGQM